MKNISTIKIEKGAYLRRNICGLCRTEALCRPLKYKNKGKWRKIYTCTCCIPVNNSIIFGDEYVVIKRKDLILLSKALKYISSALIKQEMLIYVKYKKKIKSEEDIKVGFEEGKTS